MGPWSATFCSFCPREETCEKTSCCFHPNTLNSKNNVGHRINPLCPGGFTACSVCSLRFFSPAAHFYLRQSHQILHSWLKMCWKHCVIFSINMIYSLFFSSQWKMKKGTFEMSTTVSKVLNLKHRSECENYLHFHTILMTAWFHPIACLNLIKNQQYQGQNDCIHQQTPHRKPP